MGLLGKERFGGFMFLSVPVPIFRRCTTRKERAHTQTPKKAKRKLTMGFVVVLVYFWQRSGAGVHTVFTNPTSQMIWFLASVGLLLVGCCCFCCCCAVLFCCWFAGAGWQLLLVSCWVGVVFLLLVGAACCRCRCLRCKAYSFAAGCCCTNPIIVAVL